MIRSMEGFSFASALDLNMGYHNIKLDAECCCSKAMYNCIHMGKIQIQLLNHVYPNFLVPDIYQNVKTKLVLVMEYAKTGMLS
jgi:hypothetical protein